MIDGDSRLGPLLLTGMGGVLGEGLARGGLARDGSAQDGSARDGSARDGSVRGGPAGQGASAGDPGRVGGGAPSADWIVVGRKRPAAWQDVGFVPCDLSVPGAAHDLVARLRPRAVVHAAAWSRVADCEADPDGAARMNHGVVREFAEALIGLRGAPAPVGAASDGAARSDAGSGGDARGTVLPLLFCSTDQVFDGRAERDREDDPPRPIHAYGRSKAAGEAVVRAAGGAVVRLPLLLGPRVSEDSAGADTVAVEAARAGRALTLFDDEIRAPADPAAFAPAFAAWLARPRAGVFHLAGGEAVSRLELGRRACEAAGVPCPHRVGSVHRFAGPPRPPRLVLDCARAVEELGFQPPDLRQSLAHPTRATS